MSNLTDDRVGTLKRRLESIYNEAYQTAVKNNEKAIMKLAAFNPADYPDLTAQQLKDKARSYAIQVERTTGIAKGIAKDIANVSETARKIIDGERLNVFSKNYQSSLSSIDKQLGFSVDWSVYDKNTLKAILDDSPERVRIKTLVYENGELVKKEIDVSSQAFGKVGARETYERKQRQYIRERAYRRLGDDKVIRFRLQEQLAQAVINGEGITKIATRIKNVAQMSRRQAVTIARTEILRVANQGRMLGFAQAQNEYGIEMLKKWISTNDSRTRPDHVEMQGVTAELDEPFDVGGSEMMQPLDPNGSAEQVVNCRCTMVSVLKGYSFSEKRELKEKIGK